MSRLFSGVSKNSTHLKAGKKTLTKKETQPSSLALMPETQILPSKAVVVVGGGWAALGAVSLLVLRQIPTVWVTGTEPQILPPLATLTSGPGVSFLHQILTAFEIDPGEPLTGTWVREFKNKAFREPAWTQATEEAERLKIQENTLWGPERMLVGPWENQFQATLMELLLQLEARLNHLLESEKSFFFKKIEQIPVNRVIYDENNSLKAILLGSGEEIPCDRLIYADYWSELNQITGLPRPLSFLQKTQSLGLLQASFSHAAVLPEEMPGSFFAPLSREPKENFEKHLWGYFSSDRKRSVWTLCLNEQEAENNQEIAKKLRRLKSTLDKMFNEKTFLALGQGTFSSTVGNEQVRFLRLMHIQNTKKEMLNTSLSLKKIPALAGIYFLTDANGPAYAFEQLSLIRSWIEQT